MAETTKRNMNWIRVHLKHNPIKIKLLKPRHVEFQTQLHSAQSEGPCSGSPRFCKPSPVSSVKLKGRCRQLTKREPKANSQPEENKNVCCRCGSQINRKEHPQNSVVKRDICDTKICSKTIQDAKNTIQNAIKEAIQFKRRLCRRTQRGTKVKSLPKEKKKKNILSEKKKKLCKHCGSETGCKGNPNIKLNKKSLAKGDTGTMENKEDGTRFCNETIEDAKKTIRIAMREGKKTLNDGRLTILEGKRTILQARNTIVGTLKYNIAGATKKKKSPIKNKKIAKTKKR